MENNGYGLIYSIPFSLSSLWKIHKDFLKFIRSDNFFPFSACFATPSWVVGSLEHFIWSMWWCHIFWMWDQAVYWPVFSVCSWWQGSSSPLVRLYLNIYSPFLQIDTFNYYFFLPLLPSPQPLCIQQIFSAHWQEWCIGLSLLFICNVLWVNESHICLLLDKYLTAGRNIPGH